MPLEYFNGSWSLFLNPQQYQAGDVKVVLTNVETGERYTPAVSVDKPVENNGMAATDLALSFDPGVSFQDGDQIQVEITGLEDLYGNAESIQYSVAFFNSHIPFEDLKLSETSKILFEGDKFFLTAEVIPEDTSEVDIANLKWTSSNPEVATVDRGTVTSVAEGTAVITAELGGKTASCQVTVKNWFRQKIFS